MAVNLTTPVVVPDVEYQGITKIDFPVPHFLDQGEIKINKPDIAAIFYVTTWDGDGNFLREQRYFVPFSEWPGVFKTDVQTVYSRIENYAISEGYIGAGTPEAL